MTARLALVVLLTASTLHADDATAVYTRACARCHGADGHGDGPAAPAPRPRDFTRGKFKLRSTPSGQLPTDADLLRTIARGIPPAMPSFRGLTAHERQLAMTTVKRFYPGFATTTPTPIVVPPPPPFDPAGVTRGATLFRESGCPACHGDTGTGDGAAAKDLKDGTGQKIAPANLHSPTHWKGGASSEDLFRTLSTGFDDTPMASYADALTVAQRWDLIAFVRSLARVSPAGSPSRARPRDARRRSQASGRHASPRRSRRPSSP